MAPGTLSTHKTTSIVPVWGWDLLGWDLEVATQMQGTGMQGTGKETAPVGTAVETAMGEMGTVRETGVMAVKKQEKVR